MAKKKVIVSRSGLTTCPSCMSHITLDASLAHTECPFCHTNLVAERNQDEGVFGRNTLQTLKKSKSAMLAAALGASLSMAACGEGENNDSKDQGSAMMDMGPTQMDAGEQPVAMYGAPPTDFGVSPDQSDAGEQPVAMYGAPPADFGVEEQDMNEPVAMYGAPPIDLGVEEDMG